MKTIVEIEWNSDEPLETVHISAALYHLYPDDNFTVRALPQPDEILKAEGVIKETNEKTKEQNGAS
jgi:hypothetical protein